MYNKTCEAKGAPKIGWVKLLLLIPVIGVVAWIQAYQNAPTMMRVEKLLTVESDLITLKPGDKTVVPTFNPENGMRFTYTVQWIQYTEKSWLQTSNHGIQGADGDDRIVGARVWPAKGAGFVGSGGTENRKVYYIHIRNDGPDTVSFKVKLNKLVTLKVPMTTNTQQVEK